MEDGLAVDRESRFLIVKHDSPVGVDPEKVTHVALFGLTVSTLFAFSCENRKNMIPWLKISHSFPNTLHNPVFILIKSIRLCVSK
ncbi:hypothetical protein HanPSC8_Chr05g0227231 [Helianthus annuus]|nr:hypothetical protein HanPSC8_Chr05g0227231 [Helianthus annuus]